MIRNSLILLMAVSSVLILSSCSKGVVKTVDKSVEYQSAASLPPLKKDRLSTTSQSSAIKQVAELSGIATETYKDKKGMPLLRVNSNYDTAWAYVDSKLKAENVTVYNRNQAAGFFSVGCGDIADIPEFKKRGGFRILKRKNKVVETEYCRLQVAGTSRKKTSVRFLNRYGKVSSGSYVDELLASLSNN